MGVTKLTDFKPFRLLRHSYSYGFNYEITTATCTINSIRGTTEGTKKNVTIEFSNKRISNPISIEGFPEDIANMFEIFADAIREMNLESTTSDQPTAVQNPDTQV